MPKNPEHKSHPHNPFLHDMEEDHHDDDDEDEVDHLGEHHHDHHSNLHHHHAEQITADGKTIKLNEFHEDAFVQIVGDGHVHRVTWPDGKISLVHHAGQKSQHQDEPRGSALHYLNRYPVVPLRRAAAMPVANTSHSSAAAHPDEHVNQPPAYSRATGSGYVSPRKSAAFASAPPASPTFFHGRQLNQPLMHSDEENKNEECCCCVMM